MLLTYLQNYHQLVKEVEAQRALLQILPTVTSFILPIEINSINQPIKEILGWTIQTDYLTIYLRGQAVLDTSDSSTFKDIYVSTDTGVYVNTDGTGFKAI